MAWSGSDVTALLTLMKRKPPTSNVATFPQKFCCKFNYNLKTAVMSPPSTANYSLLLRKIVSSEAKKTKRNTTIQFELIISSVKRSVSNTLLSPLLPFIAQQ